MAQLLKAQADLQGRVRTARSGQEQGSDKEETGGASGSWQKEGKGRGKGKKGEKGQGKGKKGRAAAKASASN